MSNGFEGLYIYKMLGASGMTFGSWTIASYVLTSLALYTIAKRRGIRNPWLAWIPVGQMWILGSISDQYQYVVNGVVRNKRKVLLVMEAVCIVLVPVLVVMTVSTLVYLMIAADVQLAQSDYMSLPFGFWGFWVTAIGIIGLAIGSTVVGLIALNDVYKSCDPANRVLYLLLSIFFGVTRPIFLLVCQNKDLGMPPRRDSFRQPGTGFGPQQPPAGSWQQRQQ